MKFYFIAFMFFLLSLVSFAQKEYAGFGNIGIPIRPDLNWKGTNLTAELGLRKSLIDNVVIGIGISYLSQDLKPSNTFLTYDRELFNFFLEGNLKFNMGEKIDVIPGIRLGYSTGNYTLNEFQGGAQKTQGFSITPQVLISHPLSKKIYLVPGIYINTVFTRLKSDENLIIPAVYQEKSAKMVVQPNIKLGVMYYFTGNE